MKKSMKIYALSYLFMMSVLIYGCLPPSRELIKYEDNPQCKTVLTGFYKEIRYWNSYYPAIVLKNGYLKIGIVTSYDDKGVMFIEKTSGIFDKKETVFIPYDELQTIIDENRRLAYGKVPRGFSSSLSMPTTIWMRSATDTAAPLFNIKLIPNESFSYCIKPDIYYIRYIRMGEGIRSVDIPFITFKVEADSVNDLGNIAITPTSDTTQGCIFSYKNTLEDSSIPFISKKNRITGYLRIYQMPADSINISSMMLPKRKVDIEYEYLNRDKKDEN